MWPAGSKESGDRQYVYEPLYWQGKGHPDGTAFSEADCHTGAGTGSQPETASGLDTGDAPYRRAGKRRSDVYAGNP